jgi:hypothetical protein
VFCNNNALDCIVKAWRTTSTCWLYMRMLLDAVRSVSERSKGWVSLFLPLYVEADIEFCKDVRKFYFCLELVFRPEIQEYFVRLRFKWPCAAVIGI